MEVLNAPPHKIFRNGGVRVSLPFPFFHCFVENPLKIPLKNFRLRRAWGVRVSLSRILRIRGVRVSLLDSENLN